MKISNVQLKFSVDNISSRINYDVMTEFKYSLVGLKSYLLIDMRTVCCGKFTLNLNISYIITCFEELIFAPCISYIW